MDKTLKIRTYSGDAKSGAAQDNSAQGEVLELAMKDAQIEEERSRSLGHLKTIVQLRESLKQEQAKTAELVTKTTELEAKVKALAGLEAHGLANKNAQFEEEKNKSSEYFKMIVQLRESLKQEQAKTAEMENKSTEETEKNAVELESKIKEFAVLEAKVKELPALEAKVRELAAMETTVRELTEALSKIAGIAVTGKAD